MSSPASDSAPRRRSGQFAGRGLSRDIIVATAVRLTQESGIDNLSMRRLAEALDVTPMAIYKHFDDRLAIVRAVVDDVGIRQIGAEPDSDLPWDERLIRLSRRVFTVVRAHPGVAAHVLRHGFDTRASLFIADQNIRILKDAGFDDAAAVEGYVAVGTLSISCAEAAEAWKVVHRSETERQSYRRFVKSLDLVGFPDLESSLPHFFAMSAAHRFETSLQLMVEGLRQRLHASARAG